MNLFYKLYYKIFLSKIALNKLDQEQRELTEINIKKHARIFVIIILAAIFTYFIIYNYYIDKIDTVVVSLLGVLFISGNAWFVMTFGTVPQRFLDLAVQITEHLFCSFAISMAATFVAVSITVPFLTPILFIAFITLYSASVKYDVVDALKLGIDETLYKHAQVGKRYFIRELKKK